MEVLQVEREPDGHIRLGPKFWTRAGNQKEVIAKPDMAKRQIAGRPDRVDTSFDPAGLGRKRELHVAVPYAQEHLAAAGERPAAQFAREREGPAIVAGNADPIIDDAYPTPQEIHGRTAN